MGRRRYQHPKVFQTKSADKSARRWYFRARVDALLSGGETGRIEDRFYLGSVSEMTKREAEQKRDQVLNEAINRPDVVLTSQIPFGAVLDQWTATSNLRGSTARQYAHIVEKHLRPQWGKARMCEMTPVAVEQWLIRIAGAFTRNTYKTVKARFEQVWSYAIFCRFTREVCPTTGMREIKRFGRADRAKTLPDMKAFLALLDEPWRSVAIGCILTGLRISEWQALTVRQLNSPVAEITEAVDQLNMIGPVKAKHSYRRVPMADVRREIVIPADLKPADRPFHLGYDEIRYRLKLAAKEAGIDYRGFGCHTFRRLHNTLFRRIAGDQGVAQRLAMAQLGHGDGRTNDLYKIEGDEDVKQRARVVGLMREQITERIQ